MIDFKNGDVDDMHNKFVDAKTGKFFSLFWKVLIIIIFLKNRIRTVSNGIREKNRKGKG